MLLPHVDHDNRVPRDEIAIVFDIFGGHAWAAERGGAMPSQQLFDDGIDVGERFTVSELRKTIGTNDGV